jgi:hypothetical protein
MATAAFSLAVFGARSVAWPADYETQLAAHIAATTPSGDNVASSDVYFGFNSIYEIVAFAYFSDKLRNHRVKGIGLNFR